MKRIANPYPYTSEAEVVRIARSRGAVPSEPTRTKAEWDALVAASRVCLGIDPELGLESGGY